MDKSIYSKRIQYKLFGKVVWEVVHDYEGIDLEDVEPINPIILTDTINKDTRKRE